MSLLTIVQDVTDRIGISRPTQVVGSSDNNIRMLLSLAQQEGKELAKRHDWQALLKEDSITATATEVQSGAIPTDFGRLVEGSMYNRTQHRPVIGPINAQRWQQIKSVTAVSVWSAFRIRGDAFLMTPTPVAADEIYFEYVSKYWCGAAADTEPTQEAWTADDDIGFMSEECMTLGVQWRYLRARGLDYAEPFRLYEEMVARDAATDGGNRILDLSPDNIGVAWYDPYISDGTWPLT